jgi:two-component system, NarL family, nitrate/nitrite response regulator NarL
MVVRILIADDQEMILRALRTLLESNSNFKVCGIALNGSEAVIKARELRPDVVILDLAMPVMNGLEAAREIARIHPATPILLYTMSDLPQVRLEAASVGIREVVGKSSAPQVLLDAVERVFSSPLPISSDGVQRELPLAVTSTDGPRGNAGTQQTDISKMDGRKAF